MLQSTAIPSTNWIVLLYPFQRPLKSSWEQTVVVFPVIEPGTLVPLQAAVHCPSQLLRDWPGVPQAGQSFRGGVIESLKEQFPTPPDELGFEHGRVHSFRHYFCSQAFLGGAAEVDIKDWLGHRDSKMVAHYRHLRRDDSQRKMQQIDFLGPSDGKVQSGG